MTVHIDQLKRAWRYLRGDGCTGAPDLTYYQCCRGHDADYRLGHDENGDKITRAQADNRLFMCMLKTGKVPVLGTVIIPFVYWSFVRVIGWKVWNKYRKEEADNGKR